ncbi:MAG: hypothetical protein U0796_04575 [Gemmatales bacterium]
MAPFLKIQFIFLIIGAIIGCIWWFNSTVKALASQTLQAKSEGSDWANSRGT